MNAGYSPIPSRNFLEELRDDEFRDGFVADHVRTRLALLIRALREERGWSQKDLALRMGKTQSIISRLEDPDYGKLTLRTVFEVAAAFKLPVYIDMPNWDEWFRLMSDMSSRNLQRESFNIESLGASVRDVRPDEVISKIHSIELISVGAPTPPESGAISVGSVFVRDMVQPKFAGTGMPHSVSGASASPMPYLRGEKLPLNV